MYNLEHSCIPIISSSALYNDHALYHEEENNIWFYRTIVLSVNYSILNAVCVAMSEIVLY